MILVLDADSQSLGVAVHLLRAGFRPRVASDLNQALVAIRQRLPRLIVVDTSLLPSDWVPHLHRLTRICPVPTLLLAPPENEPRCLEALRTVADDYLLRPVDSEELVARVQAALRRGEGRSRSVDDGCGNTLAVGDLRLEPMTRVLVGARGEVKLTPKQFAIISLLCGQPGRTFSREELLQLIWGTTAHIHPGVLGVHICNLRKRLDRLGLSHYLETVQGTGYRVVAKDVPDILA